MSHDEWRPPFLHPLGAINTQPGVVHNFKKIPPLHPSTAIMKKIILLLLHVISLGLNAQENELKKHYLDGLLFYETGDTDSALLSLKKAEALISRHKLLSNKISSGVFVLKAMCYTQKAMPLEAHQSYYLGLENARKYDHVEQRLLAFEGLNNLHWLVTKNDWVFHYRPPVETVAEEVFFQVEKVEPYTRDSVLVYILGGVNDGIKDSLLRADIYRSRANRGANEETLASLGKGLLKKLTPNRTVLALQVADSSDIPKPNDLARMFAYTPVDILGHKYYGYLKNSINLINNSRERILCRRFLAYYADSLMRKEVMQSFKYALIEIVDLLKADTTLYPMLREPLQDGIFQGKTCLQLLDGAGTWEANLFLDFVKEYPGAYMGGEYKFSEIFATWLLNEAPLSETDILNEVVMEYLDKKDTRNCFKLKKQIEEKKLVQKWLNKGMDALARDQITENYGYMYGLIYYGRQLGNDTALAWGRYLMALTDYNSNSLAEAANNLGKAEELFRKISLDEGIQLCLATRKKYGTENGVGLNVQTGHFGAYRVAMAPNPKYFATGGDDYQVKFWNAELGKEFKTLKLHKDEVNSVCYSRDGRVLYSASDDSTIIAWTTFTYEPIRVLKPGFAVKHISLNNDGSQIAAACFDSTVKILDAITGKVEMVLRKHTAGVNAVAFLQASDNFVFSCGNDSMIYKWNINDGNYTRWFKEKGKVLNVLLSNNGRYMVSVCTDGYLNVWDINNYKFHFKAKTATYQLGTGSNYYSDPVISPDNKFLVYASPDYKFNLCEMETGQYISYQAYRPGFPEQMQFAADGKSLFIHYPFDNSIVKADFSGITTIFNHPKRPSPTEITNYYNPTVTLDFSNDSKTLYLLSTQISSLNLTSGASQKLGFSPQVVWNPKFIWANSDRYFAEVHNKKGVFIVSRDPSDTLVQYKPGDWDEVAAVDWSPGGDMVFLAGGHNRVAAYSISKSKEVFTVPVETGGGKVLRIHLDSADNKLYVITDVNESGGLLVLDATNGKLLYKKDDLNAFKVLHTTAWLYIFSQGGYLLRLDKGDFAIKGKWALPPGMGAWPGEFFAVSTNDRVAVVQTDGNHIAFIDLEKNLVVRQVYDHDYFGTDIKISPDNKLVATAGFDSQVHLYNLETGERLLNVFAPLGEDLILSDSLGRYMASKKALNGLVFTFNDKPYDFNQFDIYLNRPDKVLAKLPAADTALIASYEAAYKKRIKRAGMVERESISFKSLPTIILRNKSAEILNTASAEVMLDIECTGGEGLVEAIQVTVNNNPLFGGRGKRVSPKASLRDTVLAPLAFGRNIIRLFCTNNKGISSLRETIEVNCNTRSRKAITYFVGIAVADYKDSRMNLQYPVKDVRDLLQTFRKYSDSLVVDTFINKKAIRNNILAVKGKLAKLLPGDRVIIAVTGHGMLDKQYDFYYATWDMDFENPAMAGLRYEDIEGLADGIAAHKKLILIDACHSGALDKEEMMQAGKLTAVEDSSGFVKGTRGIGLSGKRPQPMARNSFELMQTQFTDVVNNNGSIIISAAGGMEYAFESDQWNNGVFTYSIRRGLENKLADYSVYGNMDQKVTIMELMGYVNERVLTLTRGKQKPVSRRENVAFDWIVAE